MELGVKDLGTRFDILSDIWNDNEHADTINRDRTMAPNVKMDSHFDFESAGQYSKDNKINSQINTALHSPNPGATCNRKNRFQRTAAFAYSTRGKYVTIWTRRGNWQGIRVRHLMISTALKNSKVQRPTTWSTLLSQTRTCLTSVCSRCADV